MNQPSSFVLGAFAAVSSREGSHWREAYNDEFVFCIPTYDLLGSIVLDSSNDCKTFGYLINKCELYTNYT